MRSVSEQLRTNEAVDSVFRVTGFSFIGSGESVGMFFIKLKDYADREATATEFNQWAFGMGMSQKDGMAMFFNFPTIPGLGDFGGFEFWLEDRKAAGRPALYGAMGALMGLAGKIPSTKVQPNEMPPAPQLNLTLDREQAQSMGLAISDVYSAVQLMLAPVYVNDFMFEGRVLRVTMQADAPYRMKRRRPAALLSTGGHHRYEWFAFAGDNSSDGMVPLSSVLRSNWVVAAPSQSRFNGFPAIKLSGEPKLDEGFSSGDAMQEMERIVREDLPPGLGYDWAGQSYQERLSGTEAPMLFALSILVVFLCLAALYESWATPIAVLLVVPVGIIGSVFAAKAAGMPNDVFFKVGLITIIGLAAKNAILIVEFAIEEQKRGTALYESIIEAARLRLRPILMTSFAFILGVLPLVFATGAGANARRALGTGVVGGMLSAAILGVLLAPIFFVAIRRMVGDKLIIPAEDRPDPYGARN